MSNAHILVLGSVNVDLLASVRRLPVAGETIAGEGLVRQLGGKGANQAVAAARADGAVFLLGAIGDDADGAAMVRELVDYGVGVSALSHVPAPTGIALVLTSPADNQIVVVSGANGLADQDIASAMAIEAQDICLAQMETPPAAVQAFFTHARAAGATTILNAAPATESVRPLLPLCDILIVNESELGLLAGTPLDSDAGDDALAGAIGRLGFAGTLIVTLGPRGILFGQGATFARIPGRSVNVVDTTGAGDCFCGYLAAALARRETLETAVREANVAASIAVQSLGAASAMPGRSQVLNMLADASRH